MSSKDLLELLVPSEISDHFEFDRYTLESGVYRIYLIEKDDNAHIPREIYRTGKAVLDGYMNPLELQTYPIKGKEVFLVLKRRRWKVKRTTKGYSNSYSFHKPGMKATHEFGLFLKEIGRG